MRLASFHFTKQTYSKQQDNQSFVFISSDRKLKTPSNFLIVGLACADMLVAAVNMPITVATLARGEWTFSDVTCSAMGFVTMLTLCASVIHLAVISFNRYILICHNSCFVTTYTYRNVFYMLLGEYSHIYIRVIVMTANILLYIHESLTISSTNINNS